jgi:DNA-directed RNA polymerase specialized sigma subunit
VKGWERTPPTRGQEGVLERLRTERDKIAELERELRPAQKRRRLLVVKAVRAGLTTRTIGEAAGITSAAVSQINTRWKAAEKS